MQQIITHLKKSTFLRHNAVFFFGSLAVGGLNYVYYPILGRLLNPAAFGEVQALVSLFLQLSIFLTVLGLVTVNVVANYESEDARNQVVFEFEKLALLVGILVTIVVAVFNQQLKRFFHFESAWPFIILMVSVVTSVPFMFRSSFLRGKKKFGLASLANLLGAGGKLVLSVLLVVIGWGTAGAIAGIAISQIIASIYAAAYAARLGLRHTPGTRRIMLPNLKVLLPELRYGALVLVGSLIITIQYSLDIVVVKHYFDAQTAGLYAGISSVARIIFFLTASISLVLLPSVKLKQSPAENRQLLLKSLGLLALVGLPAEIVFMCFPKFIVGSLMGPAYHAYVGLLPKLSLAVFIISVLNLFISYYIALRRYGIALVAIIGAVVTYALMAGHHSSLEAIIDSLLLGSIVMMCLLGIWLAASRIMPARPDNR
ncbi:MAG TPA: oligosaccharide flippase family protein [Candidatus Saccharimonadales bacterium]|nr:oligosaccharide flippase family protein [Candidatus Saccharimonadales bacterium]